MKWTDGQKHSLHIETRRWFRRSAGNTYMTAAIHLDGARVVKIGPTGGYGDHGLTLAFDWLEENRYIEREHYANGGKEDGTRPLREDLGGTYSVVDVGRQGDL